MIVRLSGGVVVGIDRAKGRDYYCEARREPDGTITIVDSYEVTRAAPKSARR
jgi:hypothetical protein